MCKESGQISLLIPELMELISKKNKIFAIQDKKANFNVNMNKKENK